MKKCPFCGGINIDYQTQTEDREGVPTNAICQDCGACGPWAYEIPGEVGKANEAWNTRAEAGRIREIIAREIMRQFWGEVPADWETQARTLNVIVTDSEPSNETVLDLTDRIISRIEQ